MRAAAAVLGCAGFVLASIGMTACSGDRVVTVANTVRTEPPAPTTMRTTTVAATVAATVLASTTSAPVASAPTTATVVPTLPADPEIEAIFAAALAADREYDRQLYSGLPPERDRLLSVMTPAYANLTEASLLGLRARNRRFATGSVNDSVALRVERAESGDVAQVVYCQRNNAAEFDTRGTADTQDDLLVQEDEEMGARRMQLRRVGRAWLMEGELVIEEPSCAAAFS